MRDNYDDENIVIARNVNELYLHINFRRFCTSDDFQAIRVIQTIRQL